MSPTEPVSVHPLLSTRSSPARFNPAHHCTEAEVESMLEAARWAPSAGNSQPWAFVAGRRGSAEHARLVAHLAPSSARWAPSAALLVANLCHRYVEDTEWEYSEFAAYDLGQAVAHMVVQAQSLRLSARQFRAFDRAALEREFAVPLHWSVMSMTAFGRPVASPDGDSLTPVRQRRAREDLVWPGTSPVR